VRIAGDSSKIRTICFLNADRPTGCNTASDFPVENININSLYNLKIEQYKYKAPCGGGIEYLHRSPWESKKAMKREPSVWGYNWATLSLWDINSETWSYRLGVGSKADDLVL
jgi:hypothetical protein